MTILTILLRLSIRPVRLNRRGTVYEGRQLLTGLMGHTTGRISDNITDLNRNDVRGNHLNRRTIRILTNTITLRGLTFFLGLRIMARRLLRVNRRLEGIIRYLVNR